MATQPDPFSPEPYRTPGTPQVNGLPQPMPSRPQYPAPPSPAAGVPGRPPATPSPASGAYTYPQPPASSGLPTRGSTFPAPPAPAAPPAPRTPVAQAPAQINPATQPQAAPAQPAPQPVRPPTPQEAAPLPYGAQVQTPVGTFTKDTTAEGGSVALSPEGQQKYKEATVKLRKSMGPTPKAMSLPGAPEMPAVPGQSNFNPWTGQFTRG